MYSRVSLVLTLLSFAALSLLQHDGHAQYGGGVSSIDGYSTPLLQHSGQSASSISDSQRQGRGRCEFSSHASMTGNSIGSAKSAYHSAADTASMGSFKTANDVSTAGDGGSALDWASTRSFATEEAEEVK
jgi:hypothetical protein